MATPTLRKLEWKWNPQRESAALLVAHDCLTDEQIAKQVGVSHTTLYTWKADEAFQTRVREHVEAAREAIRTQGIADVLNRVKRKQDDWERLQAIRAARAQDARVQAHPGGSTGLVIVTEKSLRQGMGNVIVEESRIDTALLAELDRLEEAVARELGQRVEKHEVETRDSSIAESVQAKIERLAAQFESTND